MRHRSARPQPSEPANRLDAESPALIDLITGSRRLCEEGDVVAARVGPRLGYIHGAEVTGPSRHRGGRAPTPPGAS